MGALRAQTLLQVAEGGYSTSLILERSNRRADDLLKGVYQRDDHNARHSTASRTTFEQPVGNQAEVRFNDLLAERGLSSASSCDDTYDHAVCQTHPLVERVLA